MRVQKSHLRSIRITVTHEGQSYRHRRDPLLEIQRAEVCRHFTKGALLRHPFSRAGHMQISGSVTARDRPRSGFKFKFSAARVSAPVAGLTFLHHSHKLVHLSPILGSGVYLSSSARNEKKRQKERRREMRKKCNAMRAQRGPVSNCRKPSSENSKSVL